MWIERTAAEIVPKLLGNVHLGGRKAISPALVHGDLWSGNKPRGRLGGKGGVEDVAFDASCCCAHSEYELGLMRMFGGYSAGFFSEYNRLIPKTSPQNEYEDRMKRYQL
jgi:protein-ribulosamine 3-kinase